MTISLLVSKTMTAWTPIKTGHLAPLNRNGGNLKGDKVPEAGREKPGRPTVGNIVVEKGSDSISEWDPEREMSANSEIKADHTKPTEPITTQSRSNGEEDPKPKRKSAKSFAARKKNRKFENLDFDQDDERKTKTNLTTKADPQRTNAGKLQPKWKGEPQLANVEKFENHFETSTRIGTGILPISKTDAHRTKTMTREHANGVINSRRVGIADWIEHALARKEDVLNLKKMENLGIFNFNRNANKRPAPKLSHHTPQERTHGLRTDYGVEGRKGGKERKSSEKNLKSKNSGNLGILNFHRDAKK